MTQFFGILGKDGVGKTTTAINLTAALTYFGRDVILLDGDLNHPNVGLHLGASQVEKSLHHALRGVHSIKDAVGLHHSGIKVIAGALATERPVRTELIADTLLELERTAEMVIVDLPHPAGHYYTSLDAALLVTEPTVPGIADALKILQDAQDRGVNVVGAVINKTVQDGTDLSPENVQSLLGLKVLARLQDAGSVREARKLKSSVVYTHPKSATAEEYRRLAMQLIGKRKE